MASLVALAVMVSGSSAAATAAPELTEKELKNGVRVIVERVPAMRAAVVVGAYRAGSAHERRGQAGLASVVQQLAHVGAGSGRDAVLRLDAAGAIRETLATRDTTMFVTTVEARHVPTAIWFEARRMAALDASEADLKAVVGHLLRQHASRLRGDGQYAAESTLGPLALARAPRHADTASVTLAQARAFHRRFFAPTRATLVVIGPLEPDVVLKHATDTLGSVERAQTATADAPPAASRAEPPTQQSRRHTSIRFGNVHRSGAAQGYIVPGRNHADAAAVAVVAELLGGGRASTLSDKLAKKSGVFAVAQRVRWGRKRSVLSLYAEAPRVREPIELATVMDLEVALAGGVPAAVEAAKQRLAGRHRRLLANPKRRARAWAIDGLATGGAMAAYRRATAIDKVTPDDVVRVVKTYLQPEQANTVECLPAIIHLNEADEKLRRKKLEEAKEKLAKEQAEEARRRRRKKAPRGRRKGKGKGKGKGTQPKAKKPKTKSKKKKPAPRSSKRRKGGKRGKK